MASSANFPARAGGSARLRLIGLMAGVGAFALLAAAAQPGAAQNVPAAPSALAAPPNPNAGLSAAAAAATPILQEGVAAVVNDEIISTYDLRQRVLLLVVTVQTTMLFDKVRLTYQDNVLTYDLHLPTWPFAAVAWLGDVSAVLLIAVRTYRLIFHPEDIAESDTLKAVE